MPKTHVPAPKQMPTVLAVHVVPFQHGGLFGSLNVRENVGLPLREHTRLGDALIDEVPDLRGEVVSIGHSYAVLPLGFRL